MNNDRNIDRNNDGLAVFGRLEKGFQDQQLAFQSTRDDVTALKSGYIVIQRDVLNLTSIIEKLVARFEDTRKTNWPFLATTAGLLPLLIAGLGFFVTSYTTGSVAPIHAEIAQIQIIQKTLTEQVKDLDTVQTNRYRDMSILAQSTSVNAEALSRMTTTVHGLEEKTATSTAFDANSRTDRQQLNERVKKIEETFAAEVTDRRTQQAETKIQLGEVEQQFHSVSNMENLRAAQQERLNALMWEKVHPGDHYPASTFFPTTIFQGSGGSPLLQGR